MFSHRRLASNEETHGPLKVFYESTKHPILTAKSRLSDETRNRSRKINTLSNPRRKITNVPLTNTQLDKLPSSELDEISFSLSRTSTWKGFSTCHDVREDIRQHYPACRSTVHLKTTEANDQMSTSTFAPFCYTTNRLIDGKTCADVGRVFPKLAKGENMDEMPCACCPIPNLPSQPTFSWTQAQATARTSPRLLTMGSGVKFHQKYLRHLSSAEDTGKAMAGCSSDKSVPLAPVCSVPIPPSFEYLENGVNNRCSSSLVAVETQTSPRELNFSKSSEFRRSRRSRRSSGAKMIERFKKSIDHLRRAVSADRSIRCSDSFSFSAHSNAADRPAPPLTSNQLLPTLCDVPKHVGTNLASGVQYSLLQRFSDKSYRIQCKRSSTSNPFGFYIAKDANGLYVSRINSADHLVKMRNLLHVGDRILEIQGIPCKRLDIPTVTGFLRGCHIATFRLKSGKLAETQQRRK